MPTMNIVQTTIPASRATATYTDSDWRRSTEGWHVVTYCSVATAPICAELPSINLPLREDQYRAPVEMLRPADEMVLLRDSFRQLADYCPVSDAPRPADLRKGKGRFSR